MSAPDFLAELWQQFRGVAVERVEVLERYAAALAADAVDDDERQVAQQAAHKLAGALGSYGRPGSDDASRLEGLLKRGTGTADEVAAIVARLRESVT